MAAGKRRRCSSWEDLQPELLGLVLRRLPSLADRFRLGSVCGAWRRVARGEPLPPPLPWLTLPDGTFLSLPDGETHPMRHVPEAASLHGSAGNWLLLKSRCGKLALRNAFSNAVVRLPMEAAGDSVFCKLVPLSSAQDLSPDSRFAVLVIKSTTRFGLFETTSEISICHRQSAATTTPRRFRVPIYIDDLAWFHGKLYALALGKLFVFGIVSSYEGEPIVSSMKSVANAVRDPGILHQLMADDRRYHGCYRSYLVESRGKLLQVRRVLGCLSSTQPVEVEDMMDKTRTLSFEVLELVSTVNPRRHKWRRLYTLGDQALFLGAQSKSFCASECGAQRDCIYFVYDYDHQNPAADPLRDCGVFDMSNGRVTHLLPDTTVVRPQGCKVCPTWFFPC